MTKKKRIVLVTGMYKSDSHSISEYLHDLFCETNGAVTSSLSFINNSFTSLNESMLQELGHTWDTPLFLSDKKITHLIDSVFYDNAASLLNNIVQDKQLTVIKDEKASLLLPFWEKVFEKNNLSPLCIIPISDPNISANHLNIKYEIPHEHGHILWLVYMLSAFIHSDNIEKILIDTEENEEKFLDGINLIIKELEIKNIEKYHFPTNRNNDQNNTLIEKTNFVNEVYSLLKEYTNITTKNIHRNFKEQLLTNVTELNNFLPVIYKNYSDRENWKNSFSKLNENVKKIIFETKKLADNFEATSNSNKRLSNKIDQLNQEKSILIQKVNVLSQQISSRDNTEQPSSSNQDLNRTSLDITPKKHDQSILRQPTIAIYTYNFGNYRDETNKKSFGMIQGCDHFLITDNKELSIDGWKNIYLDLLPEINNIPPARVTSKYCKFDWLPNVFHQYDYLLHVDCSIVQRLNNASLEKLHELILRNPDADLIHRIHPTRTKTTEEINVLLNSSLQPVAPLIEYCKQPFIQSGEYDKMPLPALGIFIRKTKSSLLDSVFKNIYDTLCQYGIWRDQIVFCPLLYKQWKSGRVVISDNHLKQISYGCWGPETTTGHNC